MSTHYQPTVIEKTKEIINILIESQFFIDYELETTEFAEKYFLNKLTEKFIKEGIDYDIDELFSEQEFDVCLREIVAGSVLYELKSKGYVNSYEDENTDETFFLTEKGKEYIKDINQDQMFD